MLKRKSQDDQLDAAIKIVLNAAGPVDAEIDEIAATPYAYAAIRQRIASGEFPERRRRPVNFAYKSLGLIALASGIALYTATGSDTAPASIPAPVAATDSRDAESVFLGPDRSSVPIKVSAGEASAKRSPIKRSIKKGRRRPDRKLTTTERPQLPETFFALDYSGAEVESLSGGRVVRMDVPRSSLFAMGVNVPLENESASVTADVMLGPDGVARAIRLIE